MLRVLFLALAAVLIVSVGYILLPGGGSRPGSHLEAASSSAADPTTFVVRQAQPVVPVPAAAPAAAADSAAGGAAPGDLDAVMQRLRSGQRQDAAPAPSTPAAVAPAAAAAPPNVGPQVITPTPTGEATQPTPVAPPPVLTPPPVITPPPAVASRWTNVTPQGARWRMTPGRTGYTVQIDLTGGRVADVHVAPAFANLDPSAMNQRVDYLKSTILQNFPPETASYTFARDGSVSLDR